MKAGPRRWPWRRTDDRRRRHASGSRSRAARRGRRSRSLLRRLDWCCCSRRRRSSATGCGPSSGITRFDVPGDPDYFVARQAIAAAIGGVGLVVAILVPPSLYRRHWRVVYGGTIGLMIFVLRLRGGDPRLAALDRDRAVPVPAVRVREGALRPRDRRLPRRAAAADRPAPRRSLTAIGLAVVPMVLVFLQPDLGTALVYAAALAAVLFLVAASAGSTSRCCSERRRCSSSERPLVPARGGDRGAQAVPDGAPHRVREPRRRPERPHLQRQPVDHRDRRRRPRRARRPRGEPDAASTTCPSTRPTSCSRRSPSSEGSSARRSCCSSTSSSSGAASA